MTLPASRATENRPIFMDSLRKLASLAETIVEQNCLASSNANFMLSSSQNLIPADVRQKKFAHWSQRGYYPDNPQKQNQDACGVSLKFAGEDGDALFCVYDGHGMEGHDCARFAKKRLPQVLAKYLRQRRVQRYTAKLKSEGKSTKGGWNPVMWPLLSVKDYEDCCTKAFKETNKLMHEDPTVSLS